MLKLVEVFSIFCINPLGGPVSLVKRFEKRAIEDPLSVLKVCLPPKRRCSESAADPFSPPPPAELWTISNRRGGTDRKNPFLFSLEPIRTQDQGISASGFYCFRGFHLWCD
ncbi:hypothetical protein AVEN_63382-1 [Araneus ventricosus]|uniref:Uncharacterized protein n=1 Tax=Araneus ventricosus TaxID=182803 RepID=A0A4Y2KXQ3_ARAVE|nr:hypothetical protein AVEN_63382-1 [Araneus ventricosus]